MYDANWWFSSPLVVGWGLFVILVTVWSLYWKGRSLWKAARLGHLGWFIALLLLNTAGILDILYIYIFSQPKEPSGRHDHEGKLPATVQKEETKPGDQNS